MKADSFPCILLSICVILILSMGAQAKEYREVNAEVNASNISAHIENGDDIYLDNCQIIGELNASKIKIETVPNTFDSLFEKELIKEEIIYIGINEKLIAIKSNITIINSNFEDTLNFSFVYFYNSADFYNTTFNNDAKFGLATFNNRADFDKATFNNDADFTLTTFNKRANFSKVTFNFAKFLGTTFNKDADFSYATFNNYAIFLNATFNNYAYFYDATFNEDADVSYATFNKDADFFNATFNNYAYFLNAIFNKDADFSYATFNDASFLNAIFNNTDFSYATFNDASFYNATFNNTDFSYATFNNTDFLNAIFNKDADFYDATFNNFAKFLGTTFNKDADFSVPDSSENIITDGKNCEFFMKCYNNEALYREADNIYYNYRINAKAGEALSFSMFIDILSWITCGYGVRPSHTLYLGGTLIVLFSFIYAKDPAVRFYTDRYGVYSFDFYFKGSGITKKKEDFEDQPQKVSFRDALYFSVNTFTTVGNTNWYPKENFKKWATLEGLLGWTMLGIFMATLTNVIMRL